MARTLAPTPGPILEPGGRKPKPMSPHLARLLELVAADPRTDLEIALASGMATTQFSQLKRGERPTPSIDTVARVLRALGCDWSALNPPAAAPAPPAPDPAPTPAPRPARKGARHGN